MELIFLGNSRTGQPVYISKNSPNGHVLITGTTGSGKSTLLHSMEMNMQKSDNIGILVINYHGTHDFLNIAPHLQANYRRCSNFIDVKKSGLPFPLWPCHADPTEDYSSDDVNFVANALSGSCFLGIRQKACLHEAVSIAYSSRLRCSDHLESVRQALLILEEEKAFRTAAISLRQNLRMLDLVKIVPQHVLHGHCINILDLSNFDYESQIILTELTLSILWNQSTNRNSSDKNMLYIVLDEFQVLNLRSAYAPLPTLIREGRKRGIGLIMATQTLAGFDKAQAALLDNAATKVRCKQDLHDATEYCKHLLLSKEEIRQKSYLLTHLKQGDCIVDGILNHDGVECTKPLLIHIP